MLPPDGHTLPRGHCPLSVLRLGNQRLDRAQLLLIVAVQILKLRLVDRTAVEILCQFADLFPHPVQVDLRLRVNRGCLQFLRGRLLLLPDRVLILCRLGLQQLLPARHHRQRLKQLGHPFSGQCARLQV